MFRGGASTAQRRKDGAPGDYDPSAPSDEDYLDCTGRLRRFRLREIAEGLFVEGIELRRGEPTGQRFVLAQGPDAVPPWGELRELIRLRLTQRDVVQTPEGYQLLTQRLRGQLTESHDGWERDPPNVLVDDLELTWEQVGRLLLSFVGFGLRIEVVDPGAE